MLERLHDPEPGDGVEELYGGRWEARRLGPQEVQELAVARVLHRLLDELQDRPRAMRLGLRVETKRS